MKLPAPSTVGKFAGQGPLEKPIIRADGRLSVMTGPLSARSTPGNAADLGPYAFIRPEGG